MQVQEVAVVIPVYKAGMTAFERISFDRCLEVLRKYPLILAAPENLDVSGYLCAHKDIKVVRFDPAYFAGIHGYNRLMLSPCFYQAFREYRYILIYQLDAFVFSDQLEAWCAQGYDYVGAPWIDSCNAYAVNSSSFVRSVLDEQFDLSNPSAVKRALRRFLRSVLHGVAPGYVHGLNTAVGNGGLSLRKTSTFLNCLAVWKGAARRWQGNEDIFWSFYISTYNPFYRLPKLETALQFAFEVDPARCYALNENQLPFACHAWDDHQVDFWRPIFNQFGYDI